MLKKISQFLGSINDAIIVIDNKGIILQCNDILEDVLGYNPEDVIGKNVGMLVEAQIASQLNSFLSTEDKSMQILGKDREIFGIHKNGSKVQLIINISQFEDGGQTYYTGILRNHSNQPNSNEVLKKNEELQEALKKKDLQIEQTISDLYSLYLNAKQAEEQELRDKNRMLELTVKELNENKSKLEYEITERKLAEERLLIIQDEINAALEKEKELNDLKSKFISMASHEFRTPLSTILSSTNLIQRYLTPEVLEKTDKHINRIKSSVRNLTQILEDFLCLSKLEEGKFDKEKKELDIVDLINNCIEEVNVFAKKDQKFIFDHQISNPIIISNAQSLRNVFINLLSNAVKYSFEGSNIHVKLWQDEDIFHASVRDEGIGIPKEQKVYLFERFFRADNAINIQGTGLGLFIVRKYLDNLDGTIDFESKEDVGTKFTISFKNEANETVS
jgi:two-component system, LuxR family, sensor kinase FixL